MALIHDKKAFERSLIKNLANTNYNKSPILSKDLEAAVDNIYQLTNNTNYGVEIWADGITLKEDGVMIGTPIPGHPQFGRRAERVQRGHVERNDTNVTALAKAKSLQDILSIFGK